MIVKQRYEWDCGIAAVANLLGVSWERVFGNYLCINGKKGMRLLLKNKGTMNTNEIAELVRECASPLARISHNAWRDMGLLKYQFSHWSGAQPRDRGIILIKGCWWPNPETGVKEYDPAGHYLSYRQDQRGRWLIADPLDRERPIHRTLCRDYKVRWILWYNG